MVDFTGKGMHFDLHISDVIVPKEAQGQPFPSSWPCPSWDSFPWSPSRMHCMGTGEHKSTVGCANAKPLVAGGSQGAIGT